MLIKVALPTALACCVALSCFAKEITNEKATSTPIELTVLQAAVGVWDAEIEVWPAGPDAPSLKFEGVETNRAYGKHWIASDFDSTYSGQEIKVHSIVGYDLDKKQLVGTVIDEGPYAASMTGVYDKETNAVRWNTKAKEIDGTPIVQRTVVTQKNDDERMLVLSVPGTEKDEFKKFMQIRFVKRK